MMCLSVSMIIQFQCDFKNQIPTQPIFTFSNSKIKTPEQCVKYVQINNKVSRPKSMMSF